MLQLSLLTNLRSLRLYHSIFEATSLDALPRLQRLRHLDLDRMAYLSACLGQLTGLEQLEIVMEDIPDPEGAALD